MALWQTGPQPDGFSMLWRHPLRSISELTKLRAHVRIATTGRATVERPDRDTWPERLVLIVDELASNALRHGGAPVAATLSRARDRWLISVSDSLARTPPAPAEGRDPGQGGFGLYLVADLALAHGWCPEDGAKTVWAVVAGEPTPG